MDLDAGDTPMLLRDLDTDDIYALALKRTERQDVPGVANEWRVLSQQSNDKPTNAAMGDEFAAMVTAKTRTELAVSDFEPRPMLKTAVHEVLKPRFPAIDCHNHLDSLDPDEVLAIMDECGIEHIVNITMKTGDEAFRV